MIILMIMSQVWRLKHPLDIQKYDYLKNKISFLTHFNPMLHFNTPGNVRKPKVL